MIRRLYLVEDDSAVRTSLRGLLSLRPDNIIRDFANGDDFLNHARTLEPGVLLLDFNMPGSNGLDVLYAIREWNAGRFVPLFLSGACDMGLALQAMDAGALDFMEKPYAASALLLAVEVAFATLAQTDIAAGHAERAKARLASLSAREREVLVCLIAGDPNKAIAHRLGLGVRAVEVYRANLMKKLNASSLSAALRLVFAAGMVPTAERQAPHRC